MKIGVTYNLFNGEELLEGSIKYIRESVDYIGVVYQLVSNWGNKADENLLPLLKDLVDRKLVDEIYEYKPNLKLDGKSNEFIKRNIGLDMARNVGCKYHMTMDSDEFYIKNEFEYMKKIIIEGNYDSSACQMITYYKEPIYILDPLEEYYVTLLHKINNDTKYILNTQFPVIVDPSRKTKPGKIKIFKRDEIQMHHMSYIRKNISTKLNNASSKVNFRNKIKFLTDYYNNWEYPNDVYVGGNPPRKYSIKKVEEKFKIYYMLI
jgi:hypothetical protein